MDAFNCVANSLTFESCEVRTTECLTFIEVKVLNTNVLIVLRRINNEKINQIQNR